MSNVSDAFTGAAGSLGTADTGQTWANFGGGALQLDGSGHAVVTAATSEAGSVIDSGSPDATYAVTVVNGGSTNGGLVFRYVDGTNFWAVQMVGSVLYTRRYSTGALTDYTDAFSPSDNIILSVVTLGTSITIKVNGSTVRSLTDSTHQSASKGGMLARPGAIYDDFSITNSAGGGTATKLQFVAQPVGSTSTNLLTQMPTVQVQDASSVLVSSSTATITLSLETVSGSGSLTGTLSKAATAGSATWTDLGIIGSGTFRLVASSGSLTISTSSSFTYTLRSASPYIDLSVDGSDLGASFTTQYYDGIAVAIDGDRRNIVEPRRYASNLSYNSTTLAAYPAEVLDTDTFPTRTGSLINVNGDAAFLAALTTAQPGDWIIVNHASTYTGDYRYTFPFKAGDYRPGGNNVIVVMAKAMYDSIDGFTGLPTFLPPKVRVSAADLTQMPEFRNTLASGSFMVTGNTRGWRFCGLYFKQSSAQSVSQHFVSLGDGDGAAQTTSAACPVNIGLDRCAFEGAPGADMKHAVEMHCIAGYMQDCYTGQYIKTDANVYSESHVIVGWNGPGPFRIVNCLLNGGSQSIMWGGAYSGCGAPADIEQRYCYFTRPLTWNPDHPTYDSSNNAMKCNVEAKKAQRWLVESCVNENTWVAGQTGAAWLLKGESYGDGPLYGYTSDVIVMNTLSRRVTHGFNIASPNSNEPSGGPAERVVLYNNVISLGGTGIDASQNPFGTLSVATDTAIVKNTFYAETTVGQYLSFPATSTDLKLWNSIYSGPHSYGWKPDGQSLAVCLSTGFAAGASVIVNVVEGHSLADGYPVGTLFPATTSDIVYTDSDNGEFELFGGGEDEPDPPAPTVTIMHAVGAALRLAR